MAIDGNLLNAQHQKGIGHTVYQLPDMYIRISALDQKHRVFNYLLGTGGSSYPGNVQNDWFCCSPSHSSSNTTILVDNTALCFTIQYGECFGGIFKNLQEIIRTTYAYARQEYSRGSKEFSSRFQNLLYVIFQSILVLLYISFESILELLYMSFQSILVLIVQYSRQYDTRL